MVRSGLQRTSVSIVPLVLLTEALFILLPILLPQDASAQVRDVFEVSGIVRDVKRRFVLDRGDLKALEPLIDRERRNMAKFLARFESDVPGYSDKLWIDLIVQRQDFEIALLPQLTTRQVSALRVARSSLERRVLDHLVEKYLSFLGGYLALEDMEFDQVEELFEAECKKKHALIDRYSQNPEILRLEIDKINRATRVQIKKIVDTEQWRAFLLLDDPFELVG